MLNVIDDFTRECIAIRVSRDVASGAHIFLVFGLHLPFSVLGQLFEPRVLGSKFALPSPTV